MTRLPRFVLRCLLPRDVRDAMLAELDAEYASVVRPSCGTLRAAAWYWTQVFGSIAPALAMRQRRHGRWLADAAQDTRFAVRLLARQKTFSGAVIATLALGIGATTAMFSLVDAVVLRALPYREPDRLIRIWSHNPRGIVRNQISPADYFDWRDRVRGIDGLAAFGAADVTLTSAGDPVRLNGATATANLAGTLGVSPLAGRWFVDADTRGGEPVVVISERLWRERFGSDPRIIGRTVVIDSLQREVIGVMAEAFRFPSADQQIWMPLPDRWRMVQPRSARFLGVVGRLEAGITFADARDRMLAVARQLASAYPDSDRGWSVTVAPLSDAIRGDVRAPLLLLLGAVAAMLLVACANVAGLLMARGVSRARELAIRAAVGAGAGRLVRMQLVEALMLSLLGGLAGLALASWGVRIAPGIRGLNLPLLDRVARDRRLVMAAFAVSLVSALLTGMWPALKAARHRGLEMLGAGMRATGGHARARQAIVFAQIAIATALVAAGSLLSGSLYRLMAVSPGFHADRTLLADVSLPPAKYGPDARAPMFAGLLDRLRALPGVEAAAAGAPLPLSGQDGLLRFAFRIAGREPSADAPRAYLRWATPDYFRAMGIPLHAGRVFAPSDTARSAPVVVIDAELARRYFAGENPIGRRISTTIGRDTLREVVGVVGAVRQMALEREAEPHLYVPETQVPSPEMTLVIRTGGDAMTLLPDVRAIMRDLDPDLPLSNVRPLADLVSSSAAPRRAGTLLLTAFAAMAVLLTLVGVYGAVSQVVAQSTREIGVRIAMGGTRSIVMRLIVGRAVKVALAGAVAGLVLAWAGAPALSAMLYGVRPRDPLTLAGAAVAITAAAALAAYLPARRILRLDVLATLRVE
jgi:predicted permease